MSIYTEGISISLSMKPIWYLIVNGFEVEWSNDVDAYQEIVKLPKELFLISTLHAILGDGSGKANDGDRTIRLDNDDRSVPETIKAKLKELGISGSIYLKRTTWRYEVSGKSARPLPRSLLNLGGVGPGGQETLRLDGKLRVGSF